jgi:hypothetical protein
LTKHFINIDCPYSPPPPGYHGLQRPHSRILQHTNQYARPPCR